MEQHTIQCKHCGEVNDTGTSICVNCLTPLTAYGGQVGQAQDYEAKLATQVAALDQRPPVIAAAVIFELLYALAVPLWTVIGSWTAKPQVNEEGTNYLQASSGALVPIFQTLFLVPVAIALCVVAFFTWSQRDWAWKANHVVFGVIALTPILLHGFAPATWFWIVLVLVFEVLWNQHAVKEWFGLG